MADRATPDAKVAYIQNMAARTVDQPNEFQNGLLSRGTTQADADATAVGTVLASLKGNAGAIDQSIDALNRTVATDPQGRSVRALDAVIRAGEGTKTTSYTGSQGSSTTTDSRPLQSILEAAATGRDPQLKAAVFESAARAVQEVKDTDQLLTPNVGADADAKRITDGMTAILDSDTTGVVRQLKLDQPGGQALTGYVHDVIQQDPSAGNRTIGTQLARLQQGNDLNQNPLDYVNNGISDGHGGQVYVNAQNLGYYSGAMQAGINKISADAKTQGDILTNVLTTAVSAGTGWAPTPVKVGGNVVNGGIREAVREVVADVTSGNKSLQDALFQISLPKSADGRPAELAADPFFQGTRNTVIEQNR